MPHFYFHVTNSGGFVEDDEGRDLDSIEAARGEALQDIRSILSEEVKRGLLDLRGQVEITDGSGNVLATLPFDEAVELRLNDAAAPAPDAPRENR